MNESDIAPLARRLAEENNVDWRRLAGSGDGGRIVERDVLTFLAKVMAGEEDLDPTPEPVPDGMQAWPDSDVAAYRAAATAPPVERSVTATLDDDLFLFDDAPGAGAVATASAGVPLVFDEPEAAAATEPEDDDGLLLVDEPDAPAQATATMADGVDDDVFAFDDAGSEHAPTPSASSGLPDLFETAPIAVGPSDDGLFVDDEDVVIDEPRDRGIVIDLDDRRAATATNREAPVAGAGGRRANDYVATTAAASAGGADHGVDTVMEDEPVVAAAVPAHALDAADVSLVRHGQVWRRRIDDRAFRHAVSQVADVLGATPNVVALALLARAVRRVWPEVGAVDGWWWGDEGARRRFVVTDGRVADAVVALRAPDDRAEGRAARLVVADLSTIALDEAVLHLDVPLLALGRATGDGAWLTLSGDDVSREAVAALGSVAEALSAPIRLLV